MRARRIAGVVLAAGPSSRFGVDPPKQLQRLAGEPLVRRAVRRALASRLSGIVVVVGFRAAAVRASLRDLAVTVVENPDFATGLSSSVKAGLAAVDPAAAAAMFVPIDQPRLSTGLIDDLVGRYLETGGPIVVPSHAGVRGAPVIFDRRLFGELAQIEGDSGGRQLFARHRDEIVELVLANDQALQDIDSQDDWQRLGAAGGDDPETAR